MELLRYLAKTRTIVVILASFTAGAGGMATTVATNPEYVVSWVANWYCKQDANKRLGYREQLYGVTQPHKLVMECHTETPE